MRIFHSNESFLLASFLPPKKRYNREGMGAKKAILIGMKSSHRTRDSKQSIFSFENGLFTFFRYYVAKITYAVDGGKHLTLNGFAVPKKSWSRSYSRLEIFWKTFFISCGGRMRIKNTVKAHCNFKLLKAWP